MDYEKAYKDALGWMRNVYPTLTGAAKEDAEHYFPEIKESEDEKIRKELIEYLTHRADVSAFIDEDNDCKRWIAYLEKQKEPLTPEEKMNHPLYLEGFDVGKKVGEVLKEQKPADDKAFEEWIDDWWKHNKVNNPDSYDKGDEIQFDEKGFKNFCRGIRNMYAEQKPTEWSEEDEEIREEVIGDLCALKDWIRKYDANSSSNPVLKNIDKRISWLQSLRPQPNTVSVKDATKFGNLEYERGVKDGIQSEKSRQWKPSEEQMEALGRASINEYISAEQFDILVSLYQQLKNL